MRPLLIPIGFDKGRVDLDVVPITLDETNAFVQNHHRHHKPVVGHKFSIAVAEGEKVRGVAIIGRPVARGNDDGWTLEVNRCCTDGARNACSMLYGAAWRAAKALGYRKLITYTLPYEGGASLRAVGWKLLGQRGGGNWNTPGHPRIDTDAALRGQKLLWTAAEQKGGAASLTRCAAGRDGECGHAQCPQLRDGEPAKSGRHCPFDVREAGE